MYINCKQMLQTKPTVNKIVFQTANKCYKLNQLPLFIDVYPDRTDIKGFVKIKG